MWKSGKILNQNITFKIYFKSKRQKMKQTEILTGQKHKDGTLKTSVWD